MYYAGGYLEFIPDESGNKEEAREALSLLKDNNWLSNGARILLVDVRIHESIHLDIIQLLFIFRCSITMAT